MATSCYSKASIRIKHTPYEHEVVCNTTRHQYRNKDLYIKTIKTKLYADELGLERPEIEEDTAETICPICENGVLKQGYEYLHYEYKNGNFYENPLSNDYEVFSLYLICGACGSEQVDGYCLDYNKETIEMLYEMKEKVDE